MGKIQIAVYELSEFKKLKIEHILTWTHIHTHARARQVDITILNDLDYAEYSDT